ncbi:MAG: class I SAM-dependent methyltransferase [Pseudomonadales bacterium]
MGSNKTRTATALGAALALMLTLPVPALADLKESLTSALAAESRPEADRARDRNRKPLQTLEFFGLKEDMRVLEIMPGGGWYTRLLAPALKDNGKLYVAVGSQRVADTLLKQPGFEAAEALPNSGSFSRAEGAPRYTITGLKLDVEDIDLALTFRNLHNLDAAGRAAMNSAVFDTLKPGGLYGVVDHTARHMAADTAEMRRRMDPVLAIKEIQAAGFELVDYSTLHYRPDDELRYEVGRKSVTGNTDRFTLLFRKPAK